MKKSVILFIVILTFQTLIYFKYYSQSFPYDDAFITFRYSENLASGQGWVYNKGEPTSGTTSFINTLLIAFAEKVSGQTAENAGRIIPILLALVNFSVLTFLIFRLTASEMITVIFIAMYFLNPYIYNAAFFGMETNLFIFLILLVILFFYYDRIFISCIISAALPFVRPEGFLILFLLCAYIFYKRKSYNRSLTSFTILILPFVIYPLINYLCFGIPVPLSVIAKYITYENTGLIQSRYVMLKEFFFDEQSLIFIPLFFLGLIFPMRSKNSVKYIFYFVISYLFIFFIINPWMRPWYYFVIHPFIIFLSCFGIIFLVKWAEQSRFHSKLSAFNKKLTRSAALTLLLLYLTVTFYSDFLFKVYSSSRQSGFNKSVIEIGNYLSHIDSIKQKKIYTADIGYIGYATGAFIIDYAGLIYPEALVYSKFKRDYPEGKNLDWLKQVEFVKLKEPDFIVNDNIYPFYREMKRDKYILQNYSPVYSSGSMEVLKKNIQ